MALSAWAVVGRRCEPGDRAGRGRPAGRGRGVAGAPGPVDRDGGRGRRRRSGPSGPGCAATTTPASTSASPAATTWAASMPSSCSARRPWAGRPITSATTTTGRRVFSIGLVPLVLAVVARPAASRSPAGAGLDACWRAWRRVRLRAIAGAVFPRATRPCPAIELVPRAGPIAVPRQPRRRGPRRPGHRDAPDADGRPRRLATARQAVGRGRGRRGRPAVLDPAPIGARDRPADRRTAGIDRATGSRTVDRPRSRPPSRAGRRGRRPACSATAASGSRWAVLLVLAVSDAGRSASGADASSAA